jgi:hypothetical protein
VKAPVGIEATELEVLEDTVPETDEVWLDVADDAEEVGMTVPFLMYKVSRLPAPVAFD